MNDEEVLIAIKKLATEGIKREKNIKRYYRQIDKEDALEIVASMIWEMNCYRSAFGISNEELENFMKNETGAIIQWVAQDE